MKVKISLVAAMVIPAIMILGCSAQPENPSETTIDVTYDDFQQQNHITRNVDISLNDSLVVSLFSNPTTGYQWGENAEISDNTVMCQETHNYVAPDSSGDEPIVGAGGKDVWTFKALKMGTSTIKMTYSRPWESDSSDGWTYTINVTVK